MDGRHPQCRHLMVTVNFVKGAGGQRGCCGKVMEFLPFCDLSMKVVSAEACGTCREHGGPAKPPGDS